MKTCIMLLCFLPFGFHALADDRPPWMYGDMPKKQNQSYYFKVTHGQGASLLEARNNALAGLLGELAQSQGVTVRGSSILQSVSREKNGVFDEQSTFQSSYNIESNGFKARFEIVDEYADADKGYWILFAVAHNPARVTFDKVEFTTDYNTSAVWRSAIVPGWGQMYKRSTTKGVAMLSSEVAAVAGIFVCSNLSDSYYNKALAERNSGVREQYQDKSATYRNIRNGFIVAAGAIYAYNIVDAVSAKGARRYKLAVLPHEITFAIKL